MARMRWTVLFFILIAILVSPAMLIVEAQGQEATPAPGNQAPILWRTDPGANYGLLDRPATIVGDTLYVLAPDGQLSARLLTDGTTQWTVQTGLSAGDIQLSGNGGVVAVVRGREMNVYDATNGNELWTRTTANPNDVFPAASFSGDLLLTNELENDFSLPHSTGLIYGLDATTGAEQWLRTAQGGLDNYTMPVADGVVFVSLSDGNVEAIDAATGNLVWQAAASTTGYVAPIVTDDFVVAQGRNANLEPTITVLSRVDGSPGWAIDPSGFLEGVAGTNVIVTTSGVFGGGGASTSEVQLLDLATGQPVRTIPNAAVSAVAAEGDTGFLATMSTGPGKPTASVTAFDPTDDELWTLQLDRPSFDMVPCGQKLIVRHGPFAAWVDQETGMVAYDFVVGSGSAQALCTGDALAATVGSDGIVAVHDTTITPDLQAGVPLDSTIPEPFFTTLPIVAPAEENVTLGVWRGEVAEDGWIDLPPTLAGLNLYVESGSVLVLESRDANDPGAPVIRVGEGEIIAVPEGGTAVRSDDGSVARVYVAGLLPDEVAETVGDVEAQDPVLPGFDPVAVTNLADPPDDAIQISVTAIEPEAGTGTWPRLSPYPSLILAATDNVQIPTAPGVQGQSAASAAPSEEIPPDQIFSVTGGGAAAEAVIVTVDPTVTGTYAYSCAGRCIIR